MKVHVLLFVLEAVLITMATAVSLAAYPCTGQSRYFPDTIDPHRYVLCDDVYGPLILFCPLNYVWDQALQSCVPPDVLATTQPPVVTGSLRVSTSVYTAPCTLENIRLDKMYFAYPPDQTKYIQCDLWGDIFLRSCPAGQNFNPESSSCV